MSYSARHKRGGQDRQSGKHTHAGRRHTWIAARKNRAEKRQWLAEHEYEVAEVSTADVERDLASVLDVLSAVITGPPRSGESR